MDLVIYWTNFAENKLKDIFDYYKNTVSLTLARKLVNEIVEKTISLEKNPQIGQKEELLRELPQEFRYVQRKKNKIMKTIKRVFLIILILGTILLIFRGWIFRHLITYQPVKQRTEYKATDLNLISYIEQNIDRKKELNINNIIEHALSITSQQLNFTTSNNDNDPNKLINTKTANCIGYASFFSTTCNYLLKKYKLADTWTSKPQIGKLYFLGTDIHKNFNSSFFKFHDFVTVENKTTGEILAVDPTVTDYFHINFVTFKK